MLNSVFIHKVDSSDVPFSAVTVNNQYITLWFKSNEDMATLFYNTLMTKHWEEDPILQLKHIYDFTVPDDSPFYTDARFTEFPIYIECNRFLDFLNLPNLFPVDIKETLQLAFEGANNLENSSKSEADELANRLHLPLIPKQFQNNGNSSPRLTEHTSNSANPSPRLTNQSFSSIEQSSTSTEQSSRTTEQSSRSAFELLEGLALDYKKLIDTVKPQVEPFDNPKMSTNSAWRALCALQQEFEKQWHPLIKFRLIEFKRADLLKLDLSYFEDLVGKNQLSFNVFFEKLDKEIARQSVISAGSWLKRSYNATTAALNTLFAYTFNFEKLGMGFAAFIGYLTGEVINQGRDKIKFDSYLQLRDDICKKAIYSKDQLESMDIGAKAASSIKDQALSCTSVNAWRHFRQYYGAVAAMQLNEPNIIDEIKQNASRIKSL